MDLLRETAGTVRHLGSLGRSFFAIALIGLGVEHFIFRVFVTGRAPAWPGSVAGGELWAYLSGALFIAIGVALIARWRGREAALLAGGLLLGWAFLRHLPLVAGGTAFSGAWTQAGKALVFVGGSLTVAASLSPSTRVSGGPFHGLTAHEADSHLVGRVSLGLFLLLTGIQHFLFASFVATLFPSWFPGSPMFWTYCAGIALLAAGGGLLVPRTAGFAALLAGAMIFSWVWIIHLPRVSTSMSDAIAIFEALGFSGLLFVIAGRRLGRPASGPALPP